MLLLTWHMGMQVRSALVHGDVLVTGGEDARICLWGDSDALEQTIRPGTVDVSGGSVAAPSLSPPPYKPY